MATALDGAENQIGMAPTNHGFPEPMASGLKAAAAAFALQNSLLLNLLLFHQYPVWKPEVGLVILVLIATALLYGSAYAFANRWARAILEALLITAALDAGRAPGLVLIGAGVAALAFVLWKNRSVLPFVTIAALVAAAAGAVGIGQQRAPAMAESVGPASVSSTANLPAIVHIILDEHIGVDGLPPLNPRTASVRQSLEQFYLTHGFRIFGRAHSDFAYTTTSIPEILNFGVVQPHPKHKKIQTIAYFDLLASQGYKFRIYQTERLNYCGRPSVITCLVYQTQSLAALASAPVSTKTKAALILRKMLSKRDYALAELLYDLPKKLGVPLPYREFTEVRLNAVNSAIAFDRLIADLRRARPGEVYFAHILLPHSPYALTPDCRIKNEQWKRREYQEPLVERQNGDDDQILCALRKVESAYDAIRASPAGGAFVMVLHGDHGSRITAAEPVPRRARVITDEQKIADFSTLFVARAPKLAPGYDGIRLSAGAILENLARSRFSNGDGPRLPAAVSLVALSSKKDDRRVQVPLPAGW